MRFFSRPQFLRHIGASDAAPRPASVGFFGYIAAGNLGNDASYEVVANALALEYPDAISTIITNYPNVATLRYQARSVSMSAEMSRGWRRLGSAGRALGKSRDFVHLLHLAQRHDVIVVPGMGVFEESLPVKAQGLPLAMVMLAFACKLRGTPLYLLAVGAERPRDWRIRALFRYTVRAASMVTARDQGSAAALSDLLRESVPIVPDLVFGHTAAWRSEREGSRLVVGVMGGDWERAYGGCDGRQDVYEMELAAFCGDAIERGYRVVLTGGELAADLPVAQRIAAEVEKRAGSRETAPQILFVDSFQQLLELLGTAEAAVVSRYHNIVASLMVGCPTVTISYAAKCEELMGCVGARNSCIPIRSVRADALAKLVADRSGWCQDAEEERVRLLQNWRGEVAAQLKAAFVSVGLVRRL